MKYFYVVGLSILWACGMVAMLMGCWVSRQSNMWFVFAPLVLIMMLWTSFIVLVIREEI